jgi:hypothetical protein
VKHIGRHRLPRTVERRRERAYAVQVAVGAGSRQAAKGIRGEEHDEYMKRTAMPGDDRPRLWPAKDDALVARLPFSQANDGAIEKPTDAATRRGRKAAEVLGVRRAMHSADNEAANARGQ